MQDNLPIPNAELVPETQSLRDYEILDYWAILHVVYRVAVRERKHLAPLADWIDEQLSAEGFHLQGVLWASNAPQPHGVITINYDGDKIHYNMLNEANRYDILLQSCRLEAIVKHYYIQAQQSMPHVY